MASFEIPNTFSLTEAAGKSLIFPATPDIQKIIPLYMKFFCFEYNKSALGRSEAYRRGRGEENLIPGTSNIKKQIFVPAPSLFTSTTQHSYKAEPTEISTTGFDDFIKSTVAHLTSSEYTSPIPPIELANAIAGPETETSAL